ncbi:hypothetical protein MXD61_11490 [Frankia sp. AgPm24]|uniref:hypothetical protein n=1 Tax=Frankia sp. AgPm24 TaxID=631128 RepID=UPI00200C7330|nr:hypothetical protein [Frankia sp. AgPm24]MCK9922494.1 hypothetical protein [Frankia sp. AgPm24]
MNHSPGPRQPAADLVPGQLEFFAVVLESAQLTVVLDRVRAQPAGFEFELYALGPSELPIKSAHLDDTHESAEAPSQFPPTALSERAPLALRYEVRMPGLDPETTFPRVQVPARRSLSGETTAIFWVRPLPPTGDVIFLLTFDEPTGTAILSGDALREAAAAAGPLGSSRCERPRNDVTK